MAGWRELRLSLPKGERNHEPTVEDYVVFLGMTSEVIDEQRAEIAKLKMKVNRLEQKIDQLRNKHERH